MDDLKRILAELGFSLEERQPHTGGERRVFAAHKHVLFGRHAKDGVRVVIKASREEADIAEIRRERACRAALERIRFAYGTFFSPEELLFTETQGYTIAITRYIEQDMPFLERASIEQFAFALAGLKAMESAHAATYEHMRSVRDIFPTMHASDYVARFSEYEKIAAELPAAREGPLTRLVDQLAEKKNAIERYCGFLTHFDFMPQNFRIADGKIYLLDHASLRFGNKHESWARLINFMELYNSELARWLERYIRDNRSPEEIESLRLMRLYRLAELITHHARIARKSEGSLRELSIKRVELWVHVSEAVDAGSTVDVSVVEDYKLARDALRSPEEKERQIGLH